MNAAERSHRWPIDSRTKLPEMTVSQEHIFQSSQREMWCEPYLVSFFEGSQACSIEYRIEYRAISPTSILRAVFPPECRMENSQSSHSHFRNSKKFRESLVIR